MKLLSWAQLAQAVCFAVVVFDLIAFSYGWIHVPKDPDDAKMFFLLFGVINTILCVPALVNAVQKDDGFIAGTTNVVAPEKENKDEETADSSATPAA